MKILSQTMPKCNVRPDKDTDTIPFFLLVLYKVSSFCLLIRPLFLHLHHIKLEDFSICLQGEMKLLFFPSAILTISLALIKWDFHQEVGVKMLDSTILKGTVFTVH